MSTEQELNKEKRIKKEKSRLRRIYGKMEPEKKEIVSGLIERAAFMRVECEDLEADLIENGWTEPFQQSEKCDPYERARPQGQAYQTLNANYQKIIKQLDSMLPTPKVTKDADDGFGEFVYSRD